MRHTRAVTEPRLFRVVLPVSDIEVAASFYGEILRMRRRSEGDVTPIESRPWGERSCYANDPFGNPICFVDSKTLFTRSSDWPDR